MRNDNGIARTNTDKALPNTDKPRAKSERANTDSRFLYSELTDLVIAAFYRVYDVLGFGFLESVYRNALARELEKAGIAFEREVPIDVWYDGAIIGHFRADFLIDGKVIVEVKAAQSLCDADRKQVMNYLRGSNLELGLLLHFGPKPDVQRILYTNDRKKR